MKNKVLLLHVAVIIGLSGCTGKPSCVAIQNPNEKIIPAKVIGKNESLVQFF
ncbi:MAG: hypothetical protein ABW092_01645 [Candidatus Thiodiazotropha sp.]